MLLIAVVIGSTTAIAATGRVTLLLVLSGTLVWSVVPIVQLFTGLLLVRGTGSGLASALDGYFRTHRAWSLWLVVCATAIILLPNPISKVLLVGATFVVPAVVTVVLLLRYCRRELGLNRPAAVRRVLLHQTVTAAVILAYAKYASALLIQIAGRVGS